MNHREEMRRRLGADGRLSVKSPELASEAMSPLINLRIEELVLEGISPADRQRVADAVQSELARLLGERGLPSGIKDSSRLERLNSGTISLDQGARASTIGSQIASAVYQGLNRIESKGSRSRPAEPASMGAVTKR